MFSNPQSLRRPRLPSRTADSQPTPTPTPIDVTPVSDGGQLLYTPAEAAVLLRVGESWLRRRAGARQVPCTFLGKHLRFSAADLAAILAQAAQPPDGRRSRWRGRSGVRDRDLPAGAQQSVDQPEHDHNHQDGSSPWRG